MGPGDLGQVQILVFSCCEACSWRLSWFLCIFVQGRGCCLIQLPVRIVLSRTVFANQFNLLQLTFQVSQCSWVRQVEKKGEGVRVGDNGEAEGPV